LFSHLKCGIAEFTASSPEDILSEIPWTFAEIPIEILAAVYNEWITGLEGIIKRKENYCHTD
jgi:hypothetical protein